jgi:hypothetical protein
MVECRYCGCAASKVKGSQLFPRRRDLWDLYFWRCDPCDAHIGADPITGQPTGPLANAHLRKARSLAHKAFDELWRSRRMTRTQAYKWLSEKTGLPPRLAHIGKFDVEMCDVVMYLMKQNP